jgi:hypothetical protein
LAELITEHKIAFKVPEYREVIMEELTALLKQRNKDDDGKLQIIPKDEVKASIGHSPDIGDPIIYRAWFELNKEATLDSPQRHVMEEKQKQRLLINKTKIAGDSTR